MSRLSQAHNNQVISEVIVHNPLVDSDRNTNGAEHGALLPLSISGQRDFKLKSTNLSPNENKPLRNHQELSTVCESFLRSDDDASIPRVHCHSLDDSVSLGSENSNLYNMPTFQDHLAQTLFKLRNEQLNQHMTPNYTGHKDPKTVQTKDVEELREISRDLINRLPSHHPYASLLKNLQLNKEVIRTENLTVEIGDHADGVDVNGDGFDVKRISGTLNEKRLYRNRLHRTLSKGGTGSLRGTANLKIRGAKENVCDFLAVFQIWASAFKTIEGRFGCAILSYFSFLRWILFINMFIAMIMFFVIVFPFIFLDRPNTFFIPSQSTNITQDNFAHQAGVCSKAYNLTKENQNRTTLDLLLDFLQGTGFMENTLLFYGHYFNRTIAEEPQLEVYNMSIAYLLAIFVCFFVTFLLILKNSGESFKSSSLGASEMATYYTNTVFSGWNYSLSNAKRAKLKHANLCRELTIDLDEQRRKIEIKSRGLIDKVKLFGVRFAINFIIVVVLVASLALVFAAFDASLDWLDCKKESSSEALNLLMQYLPSITITVVNGLSPFLFEILGVLEQYRPSREIYVTLVRMVTLRLSSLVVVVVFLYYRLVASTNYIHLIQGICNDSNSQGRQLTCGNYDFENIKCWETHVGQQFYKLVLFDFVAVLLQTVCLEFPRRFLVKRFKTVKLLKLIGFQEFNLPHNVLDLVYSQTLCWFGMFFSPLLPVVCLMKSVLIFYLKKVSLLQNCVPPVRPYRAAKARSFFMLILLISFLMSILGVGFVIGKIHPSQSCGPFRIYSHVDFFIIDIVWNLISTFPRKLRSACSVLVSPVFSITFIIVLCSTAYMNWALAQANKKKQKILTEMMTRVGKDKQFMLRRVHDLEYRCKHLKL